LFATAIVVAVLPAGYAIFGSSDHSADVAVAPQARTAVPAVESLPMRQAEAPSTQATAITVESQVKPEVQTESLRSSANLEIKLTESGAEAKPPLTFADRGSSDRQADVAVAPQARTEVPAVESLPMREAEAPSAKATAITVESQARPEVQTESLQSAANLEIKPTERGAEAKSPPESGKGSFEADQDASSCLHSASAVRQTSPGAWPAWTFKAPGHEGAKCWYAAMRFMARHHRHHRSDMLKNDGTGFPDRPIQPSINAAGDE
jgi:hypothetical protein